MKEMVFAAGQGDRLRPLTDTSPKALVPVAGRPMIEYPLLLLRHYGIREVIINLHHLGKQIEAYLNNGAKLGLKITYSKEQELLDTGGGLLKAKPFLQDGTFIVINTDVLIDLPLAELIDFHRAKKSTATLALRPDELADQYGSIDIDTEGRIDRFLRKDHPRPSVLYQADVHRRPDSRAKIFDYMTRDGILKFGTGYLSQDAASREALYGFPRRFWRMSEQRNGSKTRKTGRERSIRLHCV